MMRVLGALICAMAFLSSQAHANDNDAAVDLAADRFRAGQSVDFSETGAADVFLAGERVVLSEPISGSAHMAGRRIETTADIGGALYAAGADLRIDAPVAGSATLAGYDMTVTAPIGGNLRAMARHVAVRAAVAGSALVLGGEIEIDAAISGDVVLMSDEVLFGPAARIGGRLTLYEGPDSNTEIPISVLPAERVERHILRPDMPMTERMAGRGLWALALGVLIAALILAVLATLVAAVAPRRIAILRGVLSDGKLLSIGYGFLTQSMVIGAAILLFATLIGALAAPFVIFAGVLLGGLGYVIAVYLLGETIITRFGMREADTLPEYALAACSGAVVASLLALVPFLGWLVFLAFSFAGVGAMTLTWLRDRRLG